MKNRLCQLALILELPYGELTLVLVFFFINKNFLPDLLNFILKERLANI